MTPRQRALRVTLKWFCMGECAGDAALCRWHADIEREIQAAVAEILGGGFVPSHPEPERDPNTGIVVGGT